MKLVFTPDWFLGMDVSIEFVSFLVLLTFFILSMRSYKMHRNKSALYLGIGFFLISLAEFANIFTKLVLYYDVLFSKQIGEIIVTYKVLKSVDVLYQLGFFFHRVLTLSGLYLIYTTALQKFEEKSALLVFFLFVMISIASGEAFYYFFHITALILLVYIIARYNQIYQKNKSENTKVLLIAFSLLTASQALYILSKLVICGVVAQILQLVSYLILLILVIRILGISKATPHIKNGAKKK